MNFPSSHDDGAGAAAPTPEYDEFSASYAQQRLWFMDQLEPSNAAYNIPLLVRLSGVLQADVLTRCIDEIVRRHETLRTTFAMCDGQLMQHIHASGQVHLAWLDLAALAAPARAQEIERLSALEAGHAFDLAAGPLLRASLLTESDTEQLLLLNMHHIISDGWSLEVFFGELVALYRAYSAGRESPLPELPVQYADHAQWEREQLEGDALAAPVEYWKRQLADAPAHLDLPRDRPRPAQRSARGAQHRLKLPPALGRAVHALGERHGLTPFMTLLAAFEVLLWRHSGQRDFCVGVPVAGRGLVEVEGLIGLFVNTLVLRCPLSPGSSFLDYAQQVKAVALEAFNHQQVPFEKLVEELKPARSMSQTPLFQAMFTLQSLALDKLSLPGLSLTRVHTEINISKFDLSLFLCEGDSDGGGFTGYLEYATDLFDAATIERMAGHFVRLLDAAVHAPQTRIGALPLLSEAERGQLLAWNDTQIDYPQGLTLSALFEAQVRHTPEATALVYEAQRLSYRELEARANRLAHRLRALGVGVESRVALCLQRSPDMVVALLAVLKAGGAYVPLDPSYPPARLAYMLEDSQAQVLLSESQLLDTLPADLALTLCMVDTQDDPTPAWLDSALPQQAGAANLAYVIYTSGSTGRPKGVCITHHAAVNFLHAMRERPGIDGDAVVLNLTSLSFDIALLELLLPLVSGARCVLVPVVATADPQALAALIEREQVSFVQATPSSWRLLLDHAWPANGSRLKALCGGETMPPDLARRLLERSASAWNMYGPTETTVWSSLDQLQPHAPLPSIGRPIANTRIHLLDASLEAVPIGVAGELYIAGEGLARAYLRRPGLTAERFVPDPFGTGGERMYRTGDLARWLPDGRIEHLGRCDHQLKLRGHRIEAGEIEAALAALAGMKQALVVLREDTPGDQRLVAYVVAAEGAAELQPAELLAALGRELPEYMVPGHVVVLQVLPLTPNGKIDRQALPAPDTTRRDVVYTAPRTAAEQILASVWAEVLKLDRAGLHDNFFALGGHSLLATQVVARLRAVHQVELPLRTLFETSTLEAAAAALDVAWSAAHDDTVAGEAPARALAPITPVSREQPLALSFAQQRLWFLDQLQPDSAFYNMPVSVRLSGPLQLDALQQALERLLQRHESLRTTFVVAEGEPMQVVAASLALTLPLHDLSALPAAEGEDRAQALARQEAREPFRLDQGPLLRVQVLRLAPQRHLLLLTLHHIVSDGWSMGVLVRDVAALYREQIDGAPGALPALPIQYADYAHWQRQWLEGPMLQQQRDYWQQQLADAPVLLALPTDRPRPAVQSWRGDSFAFELNLALLAALDALAQRSGCTPFMVLAAALDVLLWRHSGQADICLGTPIANRGRIETESLIGFFVNTLVLRSRLAGSDTFAELLVRVRDTALAAYAHQDVPFEQVVDVLKVERQLSHAPLFQVMLAEQTAPTQSLRLPGLELEQLAVDSGIAKFDLTLYVARREGRLMASFEYASDLFDATTIERMAGHFVRLLDAAVHAPQTRIGALPLLSEAERGQLLAWNDTQIDYPQGLTLSALFEAQVRHTPEPTPGPST